jgi:hypothetical protein
MPAVRGRVEIADQRGATLIEVTVATTAGIVVLFALTTMIVVTLHSTARVNARIDSARNARLAATRVMEQLRSSCVAPRVPPVQIGSTGTSLSFIHQFGSAAVLMPVLSRIVLDGDTLRQYDYEAVGGSLPKWSFSTVPFAERQLATGITPIPPSNSIFTYVAYSDGAASEVLSTPLSTVSAARTVKVRLAFSAAPDNAGIADPNTSTRIRDSAILRLTALAFDKPAADPCM